MSPLTSAPSPAASEAKLLLVDDKPENLLALDAMLEPLGHELIRARSGQEALRAVLEHDFALILLDARMPGLDGFETATEIRRRDRSRLIPIIFVTADDSPLNIAQAYEHGAVDYLAKPLNPAVLIAKVSVFVELFQQRERIKAQQKLLLAHEREKQRLADLEESLRLQDENRERAQLLALAAEIGAAIASKGEMKATLATCADSLVRHLDAAFVRIWTLDEGGGVLELRASAGMYTHLDGPHGRVPLGEFKIGTIAAERAPHLTNQVIGDPRVADQEWAERERMVAFAGYPLVVHDKLVGVIAAFARRALSAAALAAMEAVARGVAVGIDRWQIEDQLRTNERWLTTTLTSIGDGVIATDEQGRVTFLNPVASALTGWDLVDARRRPLDDVFRIVNEQSRSPVESPVAKVLREGVIVGMANHTLLLRRDGSEVPIDDSAAPIRTERGDLAGVVLVFRDASEKRRAEAERARVLEDTRAAHAEARAARDHLHALFMQAPIPICMFRGPEHRFELANPPYSKLAGDRVLVGKTVRAAFPEVEGQGFFEVLDRIYATGERYVGTEVPVELANDATGRPEKTVVNLVYEPFRDASGDVAGILVVVTDVTGAVSARKRLEALVEEGARLNAALAQAEDVLRNLVDNLPELAWSALPDGHIDFYNQGWYEYTGTTLAEMEGWGWQKVHDPELLPSVIERWRHSIETGEPFEMEFPIRGSDGRFRWFLTRVKPLRDAAGRIVRWFGTNTDIHAQREAGRKAEEANLAKDVFLTTASHELRTPLNAILGWIQLMSAGQLDPNTYVKAVETIERNAKAQIRLIEDILDGSRIISGNLHLEIRPLDMTALVRAALEALRPAANAKRIALSVTIEPEAARIVGDPDRLQQVVWNLANNAIKFTPKGGAVDIRLERSGTNIALTVRDTGQGISPDFLPHVFERFRQAEGSTTRRYGGLGLGLALVRHLVEAHGGSVRAESEGEGRGATFVVTLPVQAIFEESVSEHPAPRVRAESSVPAPRLDGVTALVVDDEADARDLVATVLRSSGAEVATAMNATQALDSLALHRPMIVVSDVGMPATDGYELMRSIRRLADPDLSQTAAIALTAYAREEDRRLALEAGFQTHLAKPVEPAELVRVVAGLVEFLDRQVSPAAREAALAGADTFLEFEKVLTKHGLHEALRFLNSRTPHRFTGIYRFEPPTLRNLHLVDAETLAVKKGDDAPLTETYCSIVGQTERAFATTNALRDDRLQRQPARESVVSYCGVLLRDAKGEPFGTLCHFDLVPCEIPIAEMPLMEAAAPLIVEALGRAIT